MRFAPNVILSAALLAGLPLLANGEAQLLPAGTFKSIDGRPGPGKSWTITDAQGAALAVTLNGTLAVNQMSIDYGHQSLHSKANGQPAPAAGWITSVTWRAGAGMFAAVSWTDKAKAAVLAGEFRYISPVMFYTEDGQVVGLHNAALVNEPGLHGMEAVTAILSAQFFSSPQLIDTPEPPMLTAALLALLGLPATPSPTEAQVTEKTTALQARLTTAEAAAANVKTGISTAVCTALALPAEATEVQALSAVAALKGVQPETLALVTALQMQVATMSTALNDAALTKLVTDAITAQKFVPAMSDALLAMGRKDMATLTALVNAAPAIAGLSGQSGGKNPDDKQSAALNAQASTVAAAFGLSAEQFAKASAATV